MNNLKSRILKCARDTLKVYKKVVKSPSTKSDQTPASSNYKKLKSMRWELIQLSLFGNDVKASQFLEKVTGELNSVIPGSSES